MKRITYPLPEGTKLKSQNEYTITKAIGQGGFGITYIATADVKVGNIIAKGARFAIKEFFLNGKCKRGENGVALMPMDKTLTAEIEECLRDFITEGERINKLCQADEHIVNVNEVFTANNTAYFVMEYLDGGNLVDIVQRKGKLSGEEAKEIIIPIAEAIGKMHKEHVLHLDIKPENIMMKKQDDGIVFPVIIDFGISMHFNKKGEATTRSKNGAVSEGYSPAEQYGHIKSFAPQVDIYALGATMFYMLVGSDPQQAFDVSTEYLERNLSEIDATVKKAVMHAMTKERKSRPASVEEFITELTTDNLLKEIDNFKSENAEVLAKKTSNVNSSDLPAIYDAIISFSKLSAKAQEELAAEKFLLNDLKIKAEDIEKLQKEIDNFKSKNAKILAKKTVSPSDLPAIKAAISSFSKLSKEAQEKLVDTMSLLDELRIKATPHTERLDPGKKPTPWYNKSVIIAPAIAFMVFAGGAVAIRSCGETPEGNKPEAPAEVQTLALKNVKDLKITIANGPEKMRTYLYTGQIPDSIGAVPQGKGTAKFDNGYIYTGNFVDGVCEDSTGTATMIYPNGDKYTGTFSGDQLGTGKYIIGKDSADGTKKGSYFQGTFQGSYDDVVPYNGKWYDPDGTLSAEVRNGQEIYMVGI